MCPQTFVLGRCIPFLFCLLDDWTLIDVYRPWTEYRRLIINSQKLWFFWGALRTTTVRTGTHCSRDGKYKRHFVQELSFRATSVMEELTLHCGTVIDDLTMLAVQNRKVNTIQMIFSAFPDMNRGLWMAIWYMSLSTANKQNFWNLCCKLSLRGLSFFESRTQLYAKEQNKLPHLNSHNCLLIGHYITTGTTGNNTHGL